MRGRLYAFVMALFVVASVAMTPSVSATQIHRHYRVVVLPPDGGADSYLV